LGKEQRPRRFRRPASGPPEKNQECASMSIRKTEGFDVTLSLTFVSDVAANQGITQEKVTGD